MQPAQLREKATQATTSPLLKVSSIAAILGVSRNTARKLILSELPHIRKGKKRMLIVPRTAWEQYLADVAAQAAKATSEPNY